MTSDVLFWENIGVILRQQDRTTTALKIAYFKNNRNNDSKESISKAERIIRALQPTDEPFVGIATPDRNFQESVNRIKIK